MNKTHHEQNKNKTNTPRDREQPAQPGSPWVTEGDLKEDDGTTPPLVCCVVQDSSVLFAQHFTLIICTRDLQVDWSPVPD